VRDYPSSDKTAHEVEQQRLEALGYWKSMGSSYLRLRNWLCGIFTCALNLPIFLLGGLFGSLYLEQVKHLSSLQSSYPAMAIFIGTVIGSPIAGWVSDKMRLRRLPMRIGALLSLAAIFSIIYIPMSLHGYVMLFFLLGLVSSVQIISYPTVTESNPRILTTTSVSVVSFTTLSGGAIFQPLFGYIMDKSGDFHIVKGMHVYSAVAYDHAMLIMPIAFAVGLIATLFIRETHCEPIDA
jgi:MFS family permease